MKSGFVTLILALIISAIGIAIAINSIIITNQNTKNNIVKEDSLKSQKVAESCMELVFDKLIKNQFYSGDETLSINSINCRIFSIYRGQNSTIVQIEAGETNYKKYLEAEINQIIPTLKIKYIKNITNLSTGNTLASTFNTNNPYNVVRDNLRLWLKADNIDVNNNAPITTWADYSTGQNISFTQLTETKRPKFIEYNDNLLPAVKFDGIDDALTAGNINLSDNTNGLSIFIVGKSNNTNLNQSYISKFSAIDNKREWRFQNDNFAIATDNSNLNLTDITNFASETNYRVFTGIWDTDTTIRTYLNNNIAITPSATSVITNINSTDTNLTLGALANGSDGFLNGEISEIIVYNRALSDTDRLAILSYLNTKYQIY